MPIIYANGTADSNGYYSGILVNNEVELLTQIKDNLVSAGFTVVNDNINSSNSLEIKGSSRSDECILIFSTESVTETQKTLFIVGDKNGLGTILSPSLKLNFVANGQSRLYLTADESAGCIFIFNPASLSKSAHFGFLNRRNINNPFVWMIGYLDQWLNKAYIAESAFGETWKEFETFYYSSSESKTSPKGGYQYLWDSLTQALINTSYTSTSSSSFTYKPWLGAIDPVLSQPVLGLYGYIEGRTAHNTYGQAVKDTTGQPMHFPGEVKFARTGLASLAPGVQCKEGTKTFISGGSAGNYQGFQISD